MTLRILAPLAAIGLLASPVMAATQNTAAPAPAKHQVVKHRVVKKKAPKKVMHHVRMTKTTKTTTKAS
ncbi:MAG: hypothetical protein ACTHM8_08900 [Sphingomonas sp.]